MELSLKECQRLSFNRISALSFVYVLISATTHIQTLHSFNLPLSHFFFFEIKASYKPAKSHLKHGSTVFFFFKILHSTVGRDTEITSAAVIIQTDRLLRQ